MLEQYENEIKKLEILKIHKNYSFFRFDNFLKYRILIEITSFPYNHIFDLFWLYHSHKFFKKSYYLVNLITNQAYLTNSLYLLRLIQFLFAHHCLPI